MTLKPSVLFIDSEYVKINTLISALQPNFNTQFSSVTKKEEISTIVHRNQPDIVFIDISFGDNRTGLQLYKKLQDSLGALFIAVLPVDDSHLRSQILQHNPFFYITKPYDEAEVRIVLKRALEKHSHLHAEKQTELSANEFCGIIGRSDKMTRLFDLINKVAEDDISTVLIRGESGTGKELVAKAIHTKSKRNGNNFVPVNCAAIPDDLLESELFGHTKGAFTGATQNKQGRIQYADGGTLFLDEIGDMKPALQAKLLRVIQEKEFEPVGGLKATPVDTRILAATHCDLEQLVKEGNFREDLYYRLSVIPLSIPPLKARKEDIPLLIDSFIKTYTTDRDRDKFSFSREAYEALLKYNWRGNVRELENLIQHMSVLYTGKQVELADLPEKYLLEENQTDDDISHISGTIEGNDFHDDMGISLPVHEDIPIDREIDFNEVINEFETKLIINAMRASGGNKKEAARLLNLKRTTLLEKIKKKKIDSDNW